MVQKDAPDNSTQSVMENQGLKVKIDEVTANQVPGSGQASNS
jgi:hypothetical protein